MPANGRSSGVVEIPVGGRKKNSSFSRASLSSVFFSGSFNGLPSRYLFSSSRYWTLFCCSSILASYSPTPQPLAERKNNSNKIKKQNNLFRGNPYRFSVWGKG